MEILSVTPMISIRPNRVSRTKLVRRIKLNDFFAPPAAAASVFSHLPPVEVKKSDKMPKLVKKFHEFEISKNSQRNLKDKISYLYQFAKSRRIKTYSGKTLSNFKVCFLTLTLPSKQIHPTAEISAECLDVFLQVLRQRLGLKNYVWRLEFQNNGNVHYHIATDLYIDYFFALKHWNEILEKKGYITAYKNQMQGMAYSEYARRYSNNGNTPNAVVYKRYLKGRASGWSAPNTIDVKNATAQTNIALYISKYFSKSEKGRKCNDLDNESNSFGIRLCFWSRSLSACKSESMPFDYYSADIVKFLQKCESVLRCAYDYCTVYYFSFSQLSPLAKAWLGEYFEYFRREIDYQPAV